MRISLKDAQSQFPASVLKQIEAQLSDAPEIIADDKGRGTLSKTNTQEPKKKGSISPIPKGEINYAEEEFCRLFKIVFAGHDIEREALLIPGRRYKVDIVCHDLKIVGECDGYVAHKFKENFKRDRVKDRLLQTLGYKVFRFMAESEIMKQPDIVMEHLEGIKKACLANKDSQPFHQT